MTPEDKLYAALNVAGVTTHVSTRILPDTIPVELAMPAIAYARMPSDQFITLDTGFAGERATFDVYCIATTRTKAEQIGDAARLAMLLAGMPAISRRSEYDLESGRYGAVITVNVWN